MFKKRKLTNDEIDYILSEINTLKLSPNKDINDSIIQPQIRYYKNELKEIETYADVPYQNVIEKIKNEFTKQFITSIAQPGEMVGVQAAQNIGQPITQCTLSGFHTTGIENVTTTKGISKFNEIINASQCPKITNCTIYLKNEFQQSKTINEIRLWANSKLKEISLDSIINDYVIIINKMTNNNHDKSFYKNFIKYYNSNQCELIKSNKFIRFYFNINKLWLNRIYFHTIANMIEQKYTDSCCVWSPEYEGIMDVYVDTSQIDNEDLYDFYEKIVYFNISQLCINQNSNITDVFVRYEQWNNSYIIDTNGSNIEYILNLDEIDGTKSISNNMREIYKMFGIEATYFFLIKTIEDILAAEGTGVSKRHLTILASFMTHTGILSSINRYGIQSQLSGPLQNASFEQTLDNFIRASFIGQKESTDDVSSSIICGSLAKIGTNMSEVLMDFN